MRNLLLYSIVVIFTLNSCANAAKLSSKGWKKYEEGKIEKANKLFTKALKKDGPKERAYEGKAFVASYNRNFSDAEKYMSKAYQFNSSSRNIYNYACFSNLNNKPSKAMDLLFELSSKSKGDLNYYRKLAAKEKSFTSLRSNTKFTRFLSGYRRLEIKPHTAFSNVSDGLFNSNDLFIVIENEGRIILVTDVVQESNKASWYSEKVVFDYPLGSQIRFILMDEDIIEHDKFVDVRGSITKTGNQKYRRGTSYMEIRISDTERSTYTSGTQLPSEVTLKELALGAGFVYLVANSNELDNSFFTRLIDCSTKAGINQFVDNPLLAAAVEEAYDSVRKRKGYSFSGLSINVVKGLVINELKNSGHKDAANMLETADYLYCVFSN